MEATYLPAELERLVDALGTARMSDTLLDLARDRSDTVEIFAFVREGIGRPLRIASCGTSGSSVARADLYSGQFHKMDPSLALLRQTPEHSVRFARVPASLIGDALYRRECFGHPGLVEKILFVQERGARQIALSFYASRSTTDAEVTGLTRLAAVALPILAKHAELISDTADQSLSERLSRRLRQSYPQLTGREREVCAGTLLGKTAEAIALDLRIAPTTVFTYRRRAYKRCSISSAAQMLERLL